MLVLTRKPGERLVIPGVGMITMVETQPGRAKLGFEFDPAFRVVREELLATKPGSVRDSVTTELQDA